MSFHRIGTNMNPPQNPFSDPYAQQQYQNQPGYSPWGQVGQGSGSGMLTVSGVSAAQYKPMEARPVSAAEAEFVVVSIGGSSPEKQLSAHDGVIVYCRDAQHLQIAVNNAKERGAMSLFIFKKMLGYRAKVEWENIEADV